LLIEHASLFSSAELVAALSGHVPSSSCNAALGVAGYCCDSVPFLFFRSAI
jgi:hypothetical protein